VNGDLPDAAARQQITEQLGRTLFVEAGAGSGKTRALVDRVAAIVLHPDDPVPLRNLAAVTFTEKAGTELRDRLRCAFEAALAAAAPGSPDAARAEAALSDLDAAAIGTLHSFARRILTEHPIQAGLPPLITVMDEVASGAAAEDRWIVLRARLLDDPGLAPALLAAMAAGMRLEDLRSIGRAFNDNWDLLPSRVLAAPPPILPPLETADLIREARRLAALAGRCTDSDDRFLGRLTALAGWAARLETAPDDPARLAVLAQASALTWGHGRTPSWPGYGLGRIKAECQQLAAAAAAACGSVLDAALGHLAQYIAEATLDAARARREDGQLEFHDLLVLARDLLRHPVHGTAARAALQHRYQRLLLDEFQDTDPIQAELAVRIAGGADAGAPDWAGIRVPEGSLFIVGDPKQSIYRFRRADIATYLHAQQQIGTPVTLQANFRTTGPVLAWINHVFGQLITATPGTQPPYQPLHATRPAAPRGPAVTLLGADPHPGNPPASQLRAREAADVTAAIQAALTQRWQVAEDALPGGAGQCWRDVRPGDIAVLVPSRTSLPYLQDALDTAGIPYQAQASSLVYRTQEIRDLLTAARAADDPSDPLALVTALRSPLFGCGDDDLWTWRHAGGRWNILAPPPNTIPARHPVRDAVTYLRQLHDDRAWLAPSDLLGRLIATRRMLEVAAGGPRARDTWRRLRFVTDQARAWSQAQHGGLRGYLTWARRQAEETTRAGEAVLPETDIDAVRIMTIHAAKGLEFPVVIVSGMTSRPGGARPGIEVLWPGDGGCQFKLRTDLQTRDFDTAKPVDEQMGHHERLRLLYVACTRARDHLIISLHRNTRATPAPRDSARTSAELLAEASTGAPSQTLLTPVPAGTQAPRAPRPVITPPPPYPAWQQAITGIRDRAARPSAVSASHLEGTLRTPAPRPAATGPLGEPADPGLAKTGRDLELPPWNKGRYGTAIGRAVHGVLQTIDLATGHGLHDAAAAQALAENIPQHTATVTRLAGAAIRSGTIQRAATLPHWRETYVATTLGGRVLEGFIDLLYRVDSGLVIVDYKTTTAPMHDLGQRTAYYRPQLAAYAAALQAATSEPVTRCILLFLTPDGATARTIDRIPEAASLIRNIVQSP